MVQSCGHEWRPISMHFSCIVLTFDDIEHTKYAQKHALGLKNMVFAYIYPKNMVFWTQKFDPDFDHQSLTYNPPPPLITPPPLGPDTSSEVLPPRGVKSGGGL